MCLVSLCGTMTIIRSFLPPFPLPLPRSLSSTHTVLLAAGRCEYMKRQRSELCTWCKSLLCYHCTIKQHHKGAPACVFVTKRRRTNKRFAALGYQVVFWIVDVLVGGCLQKIVLELQARVNKESRKDLADRIDCSTAPHLDSAIHLSAAALRLCCKSPK